MIFTRLGSQTMLRTLPAISGMRDISIWNSIKSVLGTNKAKLSVVGNLIYEHVTDNIDYPKYFLQYKMPNTFNSWFLVTELHTWMVMVKLMEGDKEGRIVRNAVVEALWQDSNTRAKQLGADNPSAVRLQLMDLSEQFQGALIIYDDGLQSDDKVLASSIWERLFDKQCNDYKNLEEVVSLVRRRIASYEKLVFEDIIKNPELMAKPEEDAK